MERGLQRGTTPHRLGELDPKGIRDSSSTGPVSCVTPGLRNRLRMGVGGQARRWALFPGPAGGRTLPEPPLDRRYPFDPSDAARRVPEPLLGRRSRLGRPAKWPRRLLADACPTCCAPGAPGARGGRAGSRPGPRSTRRPGAGTGRSGRRATGAAPSPGSPKGVTRGRARPSSTARASRPPVPAGPPAATAARRRSRAASGTCRWTPRGGRRARVHAANPHDRAGAEAGHGARRREPRAAPDAVGRGRASLHGRLRASAGSGARPAGRGRGAPRPAARALGPGGKAREHLARAAAPVGGREDLRVVGAIAAPRPGPPTPTRGRCSAASRCDGTAHAEAACRLDRLGRAHGFLRRVAKR